MPTGDEPLTGRAKRAAARADRAEKDVKKAKVARADWAGLPREVVWRFLEAIMKDKKAWMTADFDYGWPSVSVHWMCDAARNMGLSCKGWAEAVGDEAEWKKAYLMVFGFAYWEEIRRDEHPQSEPFGSFMEKVEDTERKQLGRNRRDGLMKAQEWRERFRGVCGRSWRKALEDRLERMCVGAFCNAYADCAGMGSGRLCENCLDSISADEDMEAVEPECSCFECIRYQELEDFAEDSDSERDDELEYDELNDEEDVA